MAFMRWFHPRQLARAIARVQIRTVLFVGFGIVFALWAASGYQFVQRLNEVQVRIGEVNDRFSQTDALLSSVRTNVNIGSLYLRDALLDVRPGAAEYYQTELERARSEIDEALAGYTAHLDSPGERATFARLRTEIDDFWATVLPVLGWDAARRATEARILLRRRIIPQRDVILKISDEIRALNRAAFEDQQAQAIGVFRSVQSRVWVVGLATLLVALVVALMVIGHTGALEARIREQLAKDAENTRDLQRLSARLVHVQEEERRTIARELHDEIGQALTAIKMELAVAERRLGAGATRPLEDARGITDRALQAVRDLSKLLHPTLLDDLGLAAAVEWYVQAFSARTGIRAELSQGGMEDRLPGDVEVCAYRIVQEAMTNVARHAAATSCHVDLRRLPASLLVSVEDDGKGFDVAAATARGARQGLGLLGIRERVADLRGTFRLHSQPRSGTRLIVELPALAAAPGTADADGDGAAFPAAAAQEVR